MNDDETIDLLGYLGNLRRHWIPALAIGLVVALATGFLGSRGGDTAAEVHHTKAHVMVQLPAAATGAQADAQAQMNSQLMRTFVALDDVPVLTETIAKKLGGRYTTQQVADMTKIYWGGGSQLLAMDAAAPTEQEALDLSNAAAEALVEKGAQVVKLPTDQMPRLVKVQDAVDDPMYPAATTSDSSSGSITKAVLAGIGTALVAAMVLEWVAASRRRRHHGATAAH